MLELDNNYKDCMKFLNFIYILYAFMKEIKAEITRYAYTLKKIDCLF